MLDAGTDAVAVLVWQFVGCNNHGPGSDRRFAKRFGGAAITLIFTCRRRCCSCNKEIHQPG